MRIVFADTGYWTAILNPKDDLRDKAKDVSSSLGNVQIITSEMVLTELLNYFAKRGTTLREATVETVKKLRANANVEIIPMTSKQFREALDLFHQRPDKKWSLTDCASFLVMKEKEITDALAHDKHFEQAGYKALLR